MSSVNVLLHTCDWHRSYLHSTIAFSGAVYANVWLLWEIQPIGLVFCSSYRSRVHDKIKVLWVGVWVYICVCVHKEMGIWVCEAANQPVSYSERQ